MVYLPIRTVNINKYTNNRMKRSKERNKTQNYELLMYFYLSVHDQCQNYEKVETKKNSCEY